MSNEGPPADKPTLCTWSEGYCGLLFDDRDDRFRSLIYGWDCRTQLTKVEATIPAQGAVWGFIAQGTAQIASPDSRPRDVQEAEFFVTANGARLVVSPGSQLFAVQQIGYRAIPTVGGPIEKRGRLRYIDGCSDTLLVPPQMAGDPCLNHLHFPSRISQTHHTHPSTRAGIIARGFGSCTTPSGVVRLTPGLIFVIPTGEVHGFDTCAAAMDVIAYHPDSDFGPRHEDHPMVNRTLVGGDKIDNTRGTHTGAEIVTGRFTVDSVITF